MRKIFKINLFYSREDEPSFLRSLLRSSPPVEALPPPPVHHPLYPYPSPSHVPPASFYTPLPAYRGSPSVWAMHQYPLPPVRNSYFPPAGTPPWTVPYQAVDLKKEDCSSGKFLPGEFLLSSLNFQVHKKSYSKVLIFLMALVFLYINLFITIF